MSQLDDLHAKTLAPRPCDTCRDGHGDGECGEVRIERCLASVARERNELRALLREFEWAAYEKDGLYDMCPACNGVKPYEYKGQPRGGHTPDCRLARAVKEKT